MINCCVWKRDSCVKAEWFFAMRAERSRRGANNRRLGSFLLLDHSVSPRPSDGLSPRCHADFFVDAIGMFFNGAFGDKELFSN